jgi:hypothetical protein
MLTISSGCAGYIQCSQGLCLSFVQYSHLRWQQQHVCMVVLSRVIAVIGIAWQLSHRGCPSSGSIHIQWVFKSSTYSGCLTNAVANMVQCRQFSVMPLLWTTATAMFVGVG